MTENAEMAENTVEGLDENGAKEWTMAMNSNGSSFDGSAGSSGMGAELVLVRHGTTKWNQERRYLGHSDLELLPEAYAELEPSVRKLAGLRFDGVYCSDLIRCRQTLLYLRPDLADGAVYDPRLRELDFGRYEGCTYEQLQSDPAYRAWIDDPSAVTPPGGESWGAFELRVRSFLLDLEERSVKAKETWLGGSNAQLPEQGSEPGPDLEFEPEPGAGQKAGAVESDGASGPLPELSRRFLVVTHGGVIRLLAALLAEQGRKTQSDFYAQAAPRPGELMRVFLRLEQF